MIELQQFCSKERYRPELHKPFSRADHTFATNGHVLVRLPRQTDIAEQERPAAEKTFSDNFHDGPFGVLTADIPKYDQKTIDCEVCDGRGSEHDCPDCSCTCDRCDGDGTIDVTKRVYVEIGKVIFDGKYISQLLALPGLRFECNPEKERSASFVFDGGEGILMPVRYVSENDELVVANLLNTQAAE